ncbi:MAG: helix-turn-helix transcriptional regulator [Faecalibacterium sp.]|nr:helix-turn-helix transcriptional regulator [Faecalibacterium sp.]
MNERIKKILEELGLKKVEFAERLHISRPYASELCSGAKAPSDRTISDICREFGVREAWLRTGEGEMFVQDTQSEQVAAFLADLTKDDSDTFKKRFVEMLAGLSPADWGLLERMAEKLTQKKEESP